jgi:hypothetical protein
MSGDDATQVTPDIAEALDIARDLIKAGVPVFAAAPNPERPGEYFLPKDWQNTVPSEVWLERWRPGWALAAVGGHAADFLDIDPRNGGRESEKELTLQGQFPRSFGQQSTPSGGTHHVLTPTGERKATDFMPGLDLQSGAAAPDERGTYGRGFVYIAPTVRPSKAPETLGQLRPYRWEVRPALDELEDFSGTDDSQDGLIARVHAARSRSAARERAATPATGGTGSLFMQASAAWAAGPREFTVPDAEAYCEPALLAVRAAQIGSIEERTNDAAVVLSHFIPAFWSVDQGMALLADALTYTAYDPDRPGAGWDVEKFRAVLDGRRPPLDPWKAMRRVTPEEAAAAFGRQQGDAALPHSPDEAEAAVQALMDKMLTPQQMRALPPPQPLIQGLLDLDSLAWIIGAPGSFKSFVCLDLAAHVASGRDWRGQTVTAGPVVYIAAEGTRGMGKRIAAWEKKYGPMGDARFLPLPIKIKDVVAWQTLVEACRRIQPVLVVIDTQARVTAGVEENSNTDMGVAIDAFDAIKAATGACVLIVHHTGRNGQDARGASAIDGAQDTELKLTRMEPRSSMIVKLREDKQKDMAEGAEDIVLTLVEEELEPVNGVRQTSLRVGTDLEALAGQGGEPEARVYVPTFNERDQWSNRILDVLYLYAPSGGMTKADVVGRLAKDFGMTPGQVRHSGPFGGAWRRVLALTDPAGEPIIGGSSESRFEIISDAVKAGRQARLGPVDGVDA